MQPLQLIGPARPPAARRLLAALALAAAAAPGPSRGAESEMLFTSAIAFAGEQGASFLQSVTEFGFQGFSAAAAFDPAALRVLEISIRDTISEALDAEFFEANLYPNQFTVGCLLDATPPFDDRLIPGLGIPLPLAQVVFEVPAGTPPQVTRLRFMDGAGDPPIFNVFSVESLSVLPDLLTEGLISIVDRPRFIRGDANQDGAVNVADPVFLIGFLFQDRAPPPCRDAADGNDDEGLDLADSIFVLQYYFMGGLKPPAPFPNPGPDPTEGRRELGCLEHLF